MANAKVATACAVRKIKEMGLRMASQKTEAVFMHDGLHGAPREAHIKLEGIRIRVWTQIK